MPYVTQLININTEYHPMPNPGLTSPELDASFARYPESIPVYCLQDGADFYMHHDPETFLGEPTTFIDTVTYTGEPVIWDNLSAYKARAWFIELCFQHGLEAVFV